MHLFPLRRFACALLLFVGIGITGGCSSGGCSSGKCGLPNLEGNKHKIGVSPYCGRYIEGGHGWR